MEIRAEFKVPENGPEKLVAEGALVFGEDAGPLAGMRLVGFSLWASADGETFLTVPSRANGAGRDRRYFDYLRCDTTGDMRKFKAWMLEQFQSAKVS